MSEMQGREKKKKNQQISYAVTPTSALVERLLSRSWMKQARCAETQELYK